MSAPFLPCPQIRILLLVSRPCITHTSPLPCLPSPDASPHTCAPSSPLPLADKAIAAGQQVLHTYGDLSDAQLLQTYGFLDAVTSNATAAKSGAAAAAGATAPASKSADKKKKGGVGSGKASSPAAPKPKAVAPVVLSNPHNYVTVPWDVVVGACRFSLEKACPEDDEVWISVGRTGYDGHKPLLVGCGGGGPPVLTGEGAPGGH